MAREQRKDVDYFPHDCTHGRKMHIIETRYGNDGYAVWFKLLEQLGKANNHYIDISEEMTLMFLTSVFKVDEETTLKILSDLSKLEAIDKELFEDHKIIWSDKFCKSIEDAYKKRKQKMFSKEDIFNLYNFNPLRIEQKNDKKEVNPQRIDEQSGVLLVNRAEVIPKEEKSKVKESKVNKIREDGEEKFDNTTNDNFRDVLKFESQQWLETVSIQQKKPADFIKEKLDDFSIFLFTTEKKHPNKKEFISHFINWLPKNLEKNGTKQFNSGSKQQFRFNTDEAIETVTGQN